VQEYEDELKKLLEEICTVETYNGEFAKANEIKLDPSKLPIIYIDFTGEKPDGSFELTLDYSLYIAQAAYSSNKKLRNKSHEDIKNIIVDINKKLYHATVLESQPINVTGSRKILDAKNDNAYITVFQKNINFTIPDNYIEGVNIE